MSDPTKLKQELELRLGEQISDKVITNLSNNLTKLLTPHQALLVYQYYFVGKTQTQIAKELKCDQSSIGKGIHGNLVYRDKAGNLLSEPVRYGGALNRLAKILHNSFHPRKGKKVIEIDQ